LAMVFGVRGGGEGGKEKKIEGDGKGLKKGIAEGSG